MIFYFALSVLVSAVAGNWCTVPFCQTNTHIACNNNGDYGPNCNSPQTVHFTQTEINLILNGHNQWRHDVAGGTVSGFENAVLPPAVRMAKMQWSSELAHFATLNNNRCTFSHDTCRGSEQFNYAGQNMYSFSTSAPTINVTQHILWAISLWGGEHEYARISDIDNLTSLYGGNGQVIGHFTVLANARSTHVGCGMVIFTNANNLRQVIFTCNLAFNNFMNRPVYVSGATASQCTTGRDPEFMNLCTISENINVNNP